MEGSSEADNGQKVEQRSQTDTGQVSEETTGPVDAAGSPSSSKDPQGTSSSPGNTDAGSAPNQLQELRTSDVYEIKNNIPKRFDHPGTIIILR